jgi:hypothetical protein
MIQTQENELHCKECNEKETLPKVEPDGSYLRGDLWWDGREANLTKIKENFQWITCGDCYREYHTKCITDLASTHNSHWGHVEFSCGECYDEGKYWWANKASGILTTQGEVIHADQGTWKTFKPEYLTGRFNELVPMLKEAGQTTYNLHDLVKNDMHGWYIQEEDGVSHVSAPLDLFMRYFHANHIYYDERERREKIHRPRSEFFLTCYNLRDGDDGIGGFHYPEVFSIHRAIEYYDFDDRTHKVSNQWNTGTFVICDHICSGHDDYWNNRDRVDAEALITTLKKRESLGWPNEY